MENIEVYKIGVEDGFGDQDEDEKMVTTVNFESFGMNDQIWSDEEG